MVFMTVLKSERTDSFSLESNSVDLYPGIPGDTKKEVVPTQIMHSGRLLGPECRCMAKLRSRKNFPHLYRKDTSRQKNYFVASTHSLIFSFKIFTVVDCFAHFFIQTQNFVTISSILEHGFLVFFDLIEYFLNADLTTIIRVSVWTCRDPCLRNRAVDNTVVAHNTKPH